MIWLHIWNHTTFHKDSMNIRIWCIHLSADTFTPRKFWKECFWWDEARAGSLARFTWKCEWHRLWGSPSLISSQTRVVPSIFWQGPFYGQNSILVYIQPVKIRSAVLCKSKKKKNTRHPSILIISFCVKRAFCLNRWNVLKSPKKLFWFWGKIFRSGDLNRHSDGNKMWQKHV